MTRHNSELSIFEWEMLQIWIDQNHVSGNSYFYSYRVGAGADTECVKEKWMRKMIRHNSRLKIDCVRKGINGEVEIIEVKKVAEPGAIGQLICYKLLYDEEHGTDVRLILLCRFASNTMLQLCDLFNIKIETLGAYN